LIFLDTFISFWLVTNGKQQKITEDSVGF